MNRPFISFAVANYNGEAFLRAAVESALAQRGVTVEVLIVDDRSTDAGWALAQALAAEDARVRAWQLPENRGPGGARNLALAEARGEWLAILDSDDLLHPDRLARLVAEAERSGATMIADDLMVFDETGAEPVRFHLAGERARAAGWIDLAGYLRETRMYGRHPNLGFLKPVLRLDFLRQTGLAYDERLRIAEDDDLVLRALAAGARYRLLPEPFYFYRKHGTSISHRLSAAHADRMWAAAERQSVLLAGQSEAVRRAWSSRRRALRSAWGFAHLVEALKTRQPAAALRAAARAPAALLLLRQPLGAALRRLAARMRPARAAPAAVSADPRAVLFLSRQRLTGATNGSSTYLLGLAGAVRAAGGVPHLLQPSPVLFGRMPFFRLRPEMQVFETIKVRGAIRIGAHLVATDPRIAARAAAGVLARALRRLGVRGGWAQERKAPYAIAAPWRRADRLFVARHGRGLGRVAIADYIFQAEALPYLLDPARPTAIVMHDLFSARAAQFGGGAADSVAAIDAAQEIDLLGRADAVLAIQAAEEGFVRDKVAGVEAILAPMAIEAVAAPQSGDPQRLLFVGSNTAPNVHGLAWFLERVWPELRAQSPGTRLQVAGTVGATVVAPPPGVELLGLVDDLGGLYAAAGIVVSPLRQGSGLKIKLVEALAHGKASVVTGVTLQGVEQLAGQAVLQADTPEAFVAAITALQRDEPRRAALAAAALSAARAQFGAEAAYAGFRDWLARQF